MLLYVCGTFQSSSLLPACSKQHKHLPESWVAASVCLSMLEYTRTHAAAAARCLHAQTNANTCLTSGLLPLCVCPCSNTHWHMHTYIHTHTYIHRDGMLLYVCGTFQSSSSLPACSKQCRHTPEKWVAASVCLSMLEYTRITHTYIHTHEHTYYIHTNMHT
jgi:hypothetical protein